MSAADEARARLGWSDGPRWLTFRDLRRANFTRAARWHQGAEEWTGADWSNALCGEAGEAANVVKKLRRLETGIASGATTPGRTPVTRDELVEKLGLELADVVIYADLLAHHYGIRLEDVVREKFNAVSIAAGFPERLPEVTP